MTDTLLSCPFCGSHAGIIIDIPKDQFESFKIVCRDPLCKVQTPTYHDIDLLYKAWNNRSTGWISVDTPPTKDGHYLFYINDSDGDVITVLYYTARNNLIGIKATHWQPLPSIEGLDKS